MPLLSRTETFETTSKDRDSAYIENLRTIIWEYDKAILALVSGTHQSYLLDTGQTSQRVTRLDLKNLVETRRLLIDELETREARTGRGVVTVRPDW